MEVGRDREKETETRLPFLDDPGEVSRRLTDGRIKTNPQR